ncbi:hypothetical protein OEA41_010720 [Lepraria neglecta]|uniref:NADPH-dependent diflavin oxidoreductase 1 n=1 Tax=Lepraria neglecta TaxID=209136 RepID=A0AAE0DHZ2_9LECA|nr:hypothetical protein OEA41_010720 [Lepraria neglecta]
MVMKYQPRDRSALVAYGSETGNAYDYAEELGRFLERIHFSTHVSKLDAIETARPSLRHYSILIFVTSTTGQGDLPANARLFWKSLLRKKLPPTYLQDVQFSTFGLGDSSYPKFNWAARKLHKRLVQLGANEIYPRGEADQQHDEGLDATFVPWSTDLRQHLLTKFPLPDGISPIPEEVLLEPKWKLALRSSVVSHPADALANGDHEAPPPAFEDTEPRYETEPAQRVNPNASIESATQGIPVKLDENRRITSDNHWQDVRHLVFTSHAPAEYGPGDVLAIYPKNLPEEVDQLLKQMDWTDVADRPISFTPTRLTDGGNLYPSPPISLSGTSTTLRTLLTEHLDLTAIPRRSFFSLVAHFTDDQFHKDRLLEFTKPEYIDELYDYTTRPRRSILEVLQEFESVKIPWQWAASVLPELRGRQFSIASGGQLKKTREGNARFELLVAIVKYKTVIKKIREGVCTRYLAALLVGTRINVCLQKGGLAITKAEAKRPVVMIGPGTGVAPIRALAWERLQNESADYFYRDEWQSLRAQAPFEIFPAFSRDQHQKIYVQDAIRQQGPTVYRLLSVLNGTVCVCGSSGKMPQAVRAALIDVLEKCGHTDREAAEWSLERLEKEGRYKQETW